MLTRKTTFDDLKARATALVPLLRSRASETESLRRVPDDIIQKLRDAELYRVLQPASQGGLELGFLAHVRLTSEIARGCGSTGWVFGNTNGHQWVAGLFPPEAQREVWAGGRASAISGSYAPTGHVNATDGGFILNGKWTFASGVDHADWHLLGFKYPPSSAVAEGEPGLMIIPRSDLKIDDNWHAVGMAGTGSKDVVLENTFVPSYRSVSLTELTSGRPPGLSANDDFIYRIPFPAVITCVITAPLLGMVQGAIDELVEWASGRKTLGGLQGGGRTVAELASVQTSLGKASAFLDAAKSLAETNLQEILEAARHSNVSVEMRIRHRRDYSMAAHLCVEAVNLLFKATGGSGIMMNNGIQRAWRDVNAAAHHVGLNWETYATTYGQHLLGFNPKGQF